MMMMMSQDPNTLPCPQGQGTGIPITTVGGDVEIVTLTYYGKEAEQTVEHVVSSNVSGGGGIIPVTTTSATTAVKSVPVYIPPAAKSVNCLFCYNDVQKFDSEQTKVKVNKRMMVKTSERLFQYICQHLEIDSSSLFNQSNQQLQLRPGNLPLCLGCRSVYYHQIYDAFVAYELAVDNLKKQISGCITNAIAKSVQGHEISLNHQLPDILGNEHGVMTLVKQFRRKIIQKNPSASIQNQVNSTNVVNTNTTLLQPLTAAAIDPKSVPVPIPSTNVEVVAHSSTGYKNVINLVKANVVQGVGATRLVDATGSKILQCYGVSNLPPGVIQIVPINANSLDPSLWQQQQPPPPPVSQIKREPEYKEPRAQPNACKYCNQVFPADPLALTRHMVREHGMEKPEKCPQCDFRCCEKSSLVRHMKIHLDDKERSKPYQCNECGKQYMGQSHLKSHMETHAGTRQLYNCDVCGKQFKNSSSRKHCLDKHNGVKKYQCTYCDKRFFRKEVMKSHERTHTGEKPFKCEVCGMCFTRSTSRKKHLKNVHKKLN